MTVASVTPINVYVGNASASSFPFTFPVYNQTQLIVTAVNTTTGQSLVLTIGTDYTVSGLNPAGDPASSGSVVLVNSGQAWLTGGNLATNWTLSILRSLPMAQNTSIRNQGDFYRSSLENALDYQMMVLQGMAVGLLVVTDIVTGSKYQLMMVNGVLSQQQIP